MLRFLPAEHAYALSSRAFLHSYLHAYHLPACECSYLHAFALYLQSLLTLLLAEHAYSFTFMRLLLPAEHAYAITCRAAYTLTCRARLYFYLHANALTCRACLRSSPAALLLEAPNWHIALRHTVRSEWGSSYFSPKKKGFYKARKANGFPKTV
jgi:hypothetical protein